MGIYLSILINNNWHNERPRSVAREVESAVEEALVRASRLRQAVLKSAFEGRLT